MADRKITEAHLDLLNEWDLAGVTFIEMAERLPINVTNDTVRRHVLRMRDDRRERRGASANEYLNQLDVLKSQAWRSFTEDTTTVTVDKDGVKTLTTKGPPVAAGRLVLDIIKEQARLLNLGSAAASQQAAPAQIVQVVINSRDELKEAMSLGVFKSRMIPESPSNGHSGPAD